MMKGFEGKVHLHHWLDLKDKDAFVRDNGKSIKAIAIAYTANKVDGNFLKQFPNLEQVSSFGVGYDHIDAKWAGAHGIIVTNTPDVLTESSADLTWTLILGITRRLAEGERVLRRGAWKGWALDFMLGTELRGKQLGIIGAGRIGRAVAAKAPAFGMHAAFAHHPSASALGLKTMSFDELLVSSDVISLHAPLTPATRHLLGRRELAAMKRSALLVNTGRGALVEREALLEALAQGKIAGAALDVFHDEPLKPGDPLLSRDNVVLSPHNAGQTPEVRRDGLLRAIENVANFLAGRPTNVVQ